MDEEGDEYDIDLSSIQYKPSENISKKDAKEMEKKAKIDAKYDAQLQKQIMKKPRAKKSSKLELSEEQSTDRRKMITMLTMYLLEFPEKLKVYKKINLEKKSVDELKNLYREMNITLSNKSNTKMAVDVTCGALQAFEFVAVNFTPLNCNGLTKAVVSDPETLDLIKQISLKHCGIFDVEPEQRLLGNILLTSVQLHMINTTMGHVQRANEPVNINKETLNNINNEFGDI